jgi:hypothetical protein
MTSPSSSTSSSGETTLQILLNTLIPNLHPSTFVFLTFPPEDTPPVGLRTLMSFREQEGLTVICTAENAREQGLETKAIFPSRMITLDVHSSLEAVGFIAVVSRVLAEQGIACNPVSGFFHDHCFVPVERAEQALEVLRGLAKGEDDKISKK